MNVPCFLVETNGEFRTAILPEKLLLNLFKSLRENGVETVHFANMVFEVEGIYVPAKGSKTRLVAIPDEDFK